MYDLTGVGVSGERHREVTKDQALAHLPTLATDHLVAGFLYFDARADDARLTLTVARTAAFEFGAVVANYTPVVRLSAGADGKADGAVVRPVPDDEASEFPVRARIVVNASGCLGRRRARPRRGPGSSRHPSRQRRPCHRARRPAAVRRRRGHSRPTDRRSIFVVPWPETDLVYLGTTDTDYHGPLDDPACTPEDVDYLLDAANAVTTSHLTRADVTGVWAGLRPLLAPPAKGGHVSERTADLSRRHTVTTSSHGVVTVTGGKLTTYRKMAQDTVDVVVARLGESPHRRRCVTNALPLLGATTRTRDPVTLAQPHARLLRRYGTGSSEVLAVADGRPDLLEPIVAGLPYNRREALYAAREEMAGTLDDVLSRRHARRHSARPADHGRRRRYRHPHRTGHGLGRGRGAREQVARFTEACQKELLTAGLDLA